jgi:hypothetical protein
MNIEHRTSNHALAWLNGKNEKTEIAAYCSVLDVCFLFDKGVEK